jgi:hypothetical protein
MMDAFIVAFGLQASIVGLFARPDPNSKILPFIEVPQRLKTQAFDHVCGVGQILLRTQFSGMGLLQSSEEL